MRRLLFISAITFIFGACAPKEPVALRSVKDINVDVDKNGAALLTAKLVLYNPNPVRMRLREINIDVFLNGKKAAESDQQLDVRVPSKNEFYVPLEVKVSLKELGLMDTLLGLLGGRKFDVVYDGYIVVRSKGIKVKIPLHYEGQFKLKL